MPSFRFPFVRLSIFAVLAIGSLPLSVSTAQDPGSSDANRKVARSIKEARDQEDVTQSNSISIELAATVNHYSAPEHLLFVYDGADPIFVAMQRDEAYNSLKLVPGDRLKIVGVFEFEAQRVMAESVELISAGPPVPAIEADLSRVPMGTYWCRRVQVQGHVQTVVHSNEVTWLMLSTPSGTNFLAQLPEQFPKEECEILTQATVEITATLDYVVDEIGRPTQFLCRVSSTDPPQIFEQLEQPLNEIPFVNSLETLRNSVALTEQRVRARGQVTFVADGIALLEDPSGSLLISGSGLQYVQKNEMVEVVGQMESTGARPEMSCQFVSRGGLSDALPLKQVSAGNLVDAGVPFRHCIVTGKIQHIRSEGMDRHIMLMSDGILFEVLFQANAETFDGLRLREAYSLRATGLVMPATQADAHAFSVLVDAAQDVGVEVSSLAINRQRIFLGLLAAISIMLVGAAWVLTLQLQVRRKTQHLNQITARLNSSHEAINEGILIVDLQARIESITRRFYDILGCPDQEFSSGDDVIDFLQRQIVETDRFQDFVHELRSNPEVTREREFQLRDSESIRVVVIYSAPVRNSRGVITARLWSLNDVTTRKSLEDSLFQSQKMEAVGRLAGGIAHDFNNLLMAISGNLELAKISLGQPEETVMKTIEAAEAATDRAARVVRSLLRFSRQTSVALRVENANDLVLELENLLPKSMESKVEVRHDLAADLWLAKIDGTLLQQVLLNICLNACDAVSEDGGWIRIKTRNIARDEGDYIQISIADSGSGIPDDVRSKIFEPFFTTKPPEHGTGLGLAISYAIIDQHHGRIECASKPGSGSRFDIYLPRAVDVELVTLDSPDDVPLLESKAPQQ